jgi:hypothetical protein
MRSLTAQVKWLGADPTTVAGRAGSGRGPRRWRPLRAGRPRRGHQATAPTASGTRVTRVVGWPQPFTIIAYSPGSDDDEDLYFL